MTEPIQNKTENLPLMRPSFSVRVQQFFSVNQAELGNRIVNPFRKKENPGHEGYILLTLFLIALVPRVVMYFILNGASDDSYYYIHVAKILDEGDFSYRGAFYYLGLNLYPFIILMMHKLGFGWLQGGMIWGAVISSLTVLPIYGWVKRLFDYRVAIVAAFLFAVHPDLIEYSVDPIREPTSWFFVSLFLYLAVRAVIENRLWLFVSLGLTFFMAAQTRTECWLLLCPLGIWYLIQLFSRRVNRAKLTSGLAFAAIITPVMLILINLTFLKNEETWQLGRLYYFENIASYVFPKGNKSPNDQIANNGSAEGPNSC